MGRNLIASDADFDGNPFAWQERVASSTRRPPHRMAQWKPPPRRSASHKPVIYMATFSSRIWPFFPEFRHFIVSARGKLGLTGCGKTTERLLFPEFLAAGAG